MIFGIVVGLFVVALLFHFSKHENNGGLDYFIGSDLVKSVEKGLDEVIVPEEIESDEIIALRAKFNRIRDNYSNLQKERQDIIYKVSHDIDKIKFFEKKFQQDKKVHEDQISKLYEFIYGTEALDKIGDDYKKVENGESYDPLSTEVIAIEIKISIAKLYMYLEKQSKDICYGLIHDITPEYSAKKYIYNSYLWKPKELDKNGTISL